MVAKPALPSYLLDFSVCIAVLRARDSLEQLPDPAETAIPTIVAAELWTDAEKNAETHPQQIQRLEAFLACFETVDFTPEAVRHYGSIRAELEKKGKTIGPLDLLIAAQARSLGATLITGNVREFQRVKDLKVRAWSPKPTR